MVRLTSSETVGEVSTIFAFDRPAASEELSAARDDGGQSCRSRPDVLFVWRRPSTGRWTTEESGTVRRT